MKYRLTVSLATSANVTLRALKTFLDQLRVPILAEETGLNFGRTVYFDIETGIMKVQSLNRSVSRILK